MASKTHAVRTIRGCMTRGEADPGSVAAVSFDSGVDASKLPRVCDPSEEAAWRPRLALRVDGGLSVLQ